jgi:acyl carrier protein
MTEHPMPNNEFSNDEISQVISEQIRMRLRRPCQIGSQAHLQSTLGMSSQEIVELILVLNDRFQVDALEKHSFTDLRTVADLCKLFQDAILGIVGEARENDLLSEATTRARARRSRPNVHSRKN